MSNIAIIPARGGSKRIPKKNIRDFLGKPIIAYPIIAALESHIFDEVMVSTDSQEIADMAKKYGAKVPFLRSTKNSDDHATHADVIKEVLAEYKKRGQEYEYFFCLYPAPFVTSKKLKEALELLKRTGASAVVPVTQFGFPIQRSLKINDKGRIELIWPENMNVRSQDLMPTYHDVGQYFGAKVKSFLGDQKIYLKNKIPIITPESEVQDIDTEEDWKLAEIKFEIFDKKEKRSSK